MLLFLFACSAEWTAEDIDGDGYTIQTGDCDEADAAVNPAAVEACDGIDQDCDGTADEEVGGTFYGDVDRDGFGDAAAAVTGCEAPVDTVANAEDCDDADGAVFPGAPETCDGVDDDCDGVIDEDDAVDAPTWYADADGDSWGDEGSTAVACEAPDGFVAAAEDCDDTDAAFHPGANETDCEDPNDYNCDGSVAYADLDGDGFVACQECDDADVDVNPAADEVCGGVDEDCDGSIDEDDAVDAATWYADTDGDGYGDPDTARTACTQPAGTVADATDCSDFDPTTHPGATEVCDGTDDDCDGTVDEDDAADAATWYGDGDGDGFGDPTATSVACDPPSDTVADATDCDDTDAGVYPGALELCDEEDDDCDGTVDEGVETTFYADGDGDGYGLATDTVDACALPSGYTEDATDCDDTDAGVNPAGAEICDGADDDCDGTTDEGTMLAWYLDADGDGYGLSSVSAEACSALPGFVADTTDCDDGASSVHPSAAETCNSVDDDCDGTTDEGVTTTYYLDADSDGYGLSSSTTAACSLPSGYATNATDCDDGAATVHPSATETCDSVDDDCDGTTDEGVTTTYYLDADSDGYGLSTSTTSACSVPSGYVADATDCDDGDGDVNPGGDEVCNSVDDDCDGVTDPAWFESGFGTAVSSAELSINGDASQDLAAGELVMTPATDDMDGTAFLVDLIPADRWFVSFDFAISGGNGTSGADGLTFAFLDETDPTLVANGGGSDLAVLGLSGYAIEIDTYDSGESDPSVDHVALMDTSTMTHLASASVSEVQSNGTHTLEIEFDGGDVTVWLDGALTLESTLSGYASTEVLVGFTSATGSLNNEHVVDDVSIGCP